MDSREFQHRLAERARSAGVTLSAPLGIRLESYYRLLTRWNQKINLSGLDLTQAGPEALDRLLVEPIVAANHVRGVDAARTIDIGSGGGSPAIPFALAMPGIHLLMVESKVRKATFLREAIRALELNAEVAASRFETLLTRRDLHEAHGVLMIRAVRVESRHLMRLQAFVKPGGSMLLFCSKNREPSRRFTPPLGLSATYTLVQPLQSELIVLEKQPQRGAIN